MFIGVNRHFQQSFRYIVTTRLI